MRAPPPVDYPGAAGRAWGWLPSLVAGAGMAVVVAWALPTVAAHADSRPPDALRDGLVDPAVEGFLALALGASAGVVAWLARRRSRSSERTLRWDGQDWLLVCPAGDRPDQRGDVALMLDLGPWMLVRFLPAAAGGGGPARWVPLRLAGDLARWAALRGALWNWRPHGAGRP